MKFGGDIYHSGYHRERREKEVTKEGGKGVLRSGGRAQSVTKLQEWTF